MKKTLLLFFIIFSSIFYSQENCNNGIDDDGDGKIDLNDTDCTCNNVTTSLLQNHSFEEKTSCPYNFDDLNFISPWSKGTIPSPDYINCNSLESTLYNKNLQNIPDGKGIVRAVYQNNHKEYLATKLASPLQLGIKYQLTLNIATLMTVNVSPTDIFVDSNFLEPTYVTLYGCTNKDNFPLYTNSDPNSFDPSWIEIGKILYQPRSVWSEITINFTPNIDINAIMLGPSKVLPPSFDYVYLPTFSGLYEPSFLYDNLRLNTAENFGVTIIQNGNFCNNDLVLTANLTKTMNSPTTYQWYKNGIAINGATNQSYSIPSDKSNLGEYAVKVTNTNDCFISSKLTINNSIPNPSVTVVEPSCQDTNGYIEVNDLGLEYSFRKGLSLQDSHYSSKDLVWQTDAKFTTKEYGKYYIQTRTSSGCISTPTIVTIDTPTLLDRPTFSIIQPTCNSGGTITITTSATQYSFDNGLTWGNNATKTNLPPGNYFIKIKNNSGCESYAQNVFLYTYYINSPTYTVTEPSCNQGGSITITTTAAGYSFDNGENWTTNPTVTDLAPGYYNVRIRNEFGCESKPNVYQIYFERFSIPYPEIKITQPDNCNKTGTITFLKPAAQYSLDDGATWTTNQTISNLPIGGSYIIKTKNELGCESERNYATIYPYHLPQPTYTKTSPTCSINGNLSITTNAFEYSFDNGETWTKNPIKTIPSGTEYTALPIIIKDELGCTSEPLYISVYPDIYLDFYPEYKIIKGVTCDSGASVTITTAAAEYSFDDGKTWSTNPTATNLPGGNSYALKVKDSYGCISYYKIIYIPFNVNESYLNIPTYTITQPSCENKTGTITITTQASFYSFDGGKTWETNPTKSNLEEGNYEIVIKNETGCKSFPFNIHIYSYFLDTPHYEIMQPTSCEANATGSITITSPADFYSFNDGATWTTNPTASNLPVGFKYLIKIKNKQGCFSQSYPVYFTPLKLKPAEYTVIYPSCGKGGSITVTTPAPFYSFDGGETWGTNPTVSNLPAGYYYPHPKIKNELGCESESSYSINFHIFDTAPLNIQITQPTCESKNKGSITINTPAEQYSFDDGRTWSQYNTATNLSPGNYTVITKNNLGCATGVGHVQLFPFYLPRPTYTTTPPRCGVGGSITITTAAALYSFDNGKTWSTNPTASNLDEGSYGINIKNELGCESYYQYIYVPKFYLDPPTNTIAQPNCESSGSITFTTISSQYSIDNGASWSSNASFTNLVPGNYYLKIKNNLGCESNYKSVTLYNVNLPAQKPTISIQQPSSCTTSKGKISVTTNANLYSFDDGLTWSSNPTATDLNTGDYFIKIKNSSTGCPSPSVKATINTPLDAIGIPNYNISQPTTCANPYGTINITTVASAYSFDDGISWNSNPNSGNLPPGQYKIKIKNSAACESEAIPIQINIPTDYPAIPTYTINQPDCNNSKGVITINTEATEFSFDNGNSWSTSKVSTLLNPGDYLLKIKNTSDCISNVNKATIIPYINLTPKASASGSQTFCIQQNATLNSISITGQNIKWYSALTNGNLLSNTTSLQKDKTYYASQTINGCESERIPVLINIQNTPTPTGDSSQSFCSTQNATLNDIEITGTNIKWYNGSNIELPNTTLISNNVTYYATQTINNCESINKLAITTTLINTLNANNYTVEFCDDNNNGKETINLSVFNSELIATPAGNNFSYYTSLTAAENQTANSRINNINNYILPTGIYTVFVRIDSPNSCHQVVELNLSLYSKPSIPIEAVMPICEGSSIIVNAGTGDSFLWSTGEITPSITIQTPGDYSVTVTNDHDLISCSTTKDFTVKKSTIATINSIETKDWTDNQNIIKVFVSGEGDFEYSIDGIHFQDSNEFSNVITGKYSVQVRDKNGCGTVTEEIYLLMYPKFFTPNGDGYNDTWKIKFSDSEKNISIKIFDRYGKLLKHLLPDESWNGTFNGLELPADDYWFIVNRADGKDYKGHFSLKR